MVCFSLVFCCLCAGCINNYLLLWFLTGGWEKNQRPLGFKIDFLVAFCHTTQRIDCHTQKERSSRCGHWHLKRYTLSAWRSDQYSSWMVKTCYATGMQQVFHAAIISPLIWAIVKPDCITLHYNIIPIGVHFLYATTISLVVITVFFFL